VKFVSKKIHAFGNSAGRRKDSFLAKPKGAWRETGLRPCAINSKPPPVFPFRVQNAKDNDPVAFYPVEKFVREPAREQPAKVAVIKRTIFRVSFQPVNCRPNLNQQFIAQTGALGFIP
jgi:hypothetical protein